MHARTLESALEAGIRQYGHYIYTGGASDALRNSENIRYLSILTDDTHYEFNLVYRKGAYIDPSLENFSRIFMGELPEGYAGSSKPLHQYQVENRTA